MRKEATTVVIVLLCIAVCYAIWKIHVITAALQPILNAIDLIKGFMP